MKNTKLWIRFYIVETCFQLSSKVILRSSLNEWALGSTRYRVRLKIAFLFSKCFYISPYKSDFITSFLIFFHSSKFFSLLFFLQKSFVFIVETEQKTALHCYLPSPIFRSWSTIDVRIVMILAIGRPGIWENFVFDKTIQFKLLRAKE